jgi:hypothetical protein
MRGRVSVSDASVSLIVDSISGGQDKIYIANVTGNNWMFQSSVDMDTGQRVVVAIPDKNGYAGGPSKSQPFYILGSATSLPTIKLILQKKLVTTPRPPKPVMPKFPKDTKNDRVMNQYTSALKKYFKDLEISKKFKERQYEQMSIGWSTTNAFLVKVNSKEYSPFGINVVQSGSHNAAGSVVAYTLNIEAVGPLGTTSIPCSFTLKTIK